MSTIVKELLQIAQHFESVSTQGKIPEIQEALERLNNAAEQAGKSWCGSSLGYHSRIYYENLKPVPPGARFSREWGFQRRISNETVGNWVECDFETVVDAIYKMANNPDLSAAEAFVKTVYAEAEDMRPELISLLSTEFQTRSDPFLVDLKEKVENYKFYNLSDFIESFRPSGQFISRDYVAIEQGPIPSPHHAVMAKVIMIRYYLKISEEFAKIARQAASHISRRERREYEQQAAKIKDRDLDRELRKIQIDGIKLQLIDQAKNLNKLREQAATYGSLSSAPLNVQNEIERMETHIAELQEKLGKLEESS